MDKSKFSLIITNLQKNIPISFDDVEHVCKVIERQKSRNNMFNPGFTAGEAIDYYKNQESLKRDIEKILNIPM